MICSNCGDEMKAGQVVLSGTAIGFMMVGLSHKNLYFKSSEISKMVLGDSKRKMAYYCPNCGGVFIKNKRVVDPGFNPENPAVPIEEGEDDSKVVI